MYSLEFERVAQKVAAITKQPHIGENFKKERIDLVGYTHPTPFLSYKTRLGVTSDVRQDVLMRMPEEHLKVFGVASYGDRYDLLYTRSPATQACVDVHGHNKFRFRIQSWARAEHRRNMGSSSNQSSTHLQQDLPEPTETDQTASTLARSPAIEGDTFSSRNMGTLMIGCLSMYTNVGNMNLPNPFSY